TMAQIAANCAIGTPVFAIRVTVPSNPPILPKPAHMKMVAISIRPIAVAMDPAVLCCEDDMLFLLASVQASPATLDKRNTDRPKRPVACVHHIANGNVDWAREAPGKHNLTAFQFVAYG